MIKGPALSGTKVVVVFTRFFNDIRELSQASLQGIGTRLGDGVDICVVSAVWAKTVINGMVRAKIMENRMMVGLEVMVSVGCEAVAQELTIAGEAIRTCRM